MKNVLDLTLNELLDGQEHSAQFGTENYFPFPIGDETMKIEDYLYLYFTRHLRVNHTLFCIKSDIIFNLGLRYSSIEEVAFNHQIIHVNTDDLVVYATAYFYCTISYCGYSYAVYRNWKTGVFYYICVIYSRCVEICPHQPNNFAFLVYDTESEIKNGFKAIGAPEYETLHRNYKINKLLDL